MCVVSQKYQFFFKTKKQPMATRSRKQRLLNIWLKMNSRCFDPSDMSYIRYGGKGITVCDRWKTSFITFYGDMEPSYKEGLTIERIDNKGNYCPPNCKWATMEEQSRNKSNNKYLTHKGVTLVVADWVKITGLSHKCIQYRLSLGWDVEKTLTHPLRLKTRNLGTAACSFCGKQFKKLVKNQRFCSYKHKDKFYTIQNRRESKRKK